MSMNMQLPYGFMPQFPNFNNESAPLQKIDELEQRINDLEKKVKKLEEQSTYNPYHNSSMQML